MAGKKKEKLAKNNFFEDVYAVARLIPKGRATSYGAIAHYLGVKSSARMVGWAMHSCPKDVPAHRVVNSQGVLTGKHHFKGSNTMEKRLAKEGIEPLDDKIVRFDDVFWDPSIELTLK